MTPLQHTKDIDALFFPLLDAIAEELGAQPRHMLAVMYSESGCRADAHNDNPKNLPPEKRYNASGLIQFMPATLPLVGWTQGHAAFRALSPTKQLPYVRRYYLAYKGHLGSIAGLYVATFLPALISRCGNPSFVLTASKGPLPWAYAPNAAFDANGDLAITVGELEDAVRRNCRGARWAELVARLEDGNVHETDETDPGIDVRTTMGLQRALSQLGFDPGVVDGVVGPRTRSAVVAFQVAAGLAADGIVGPKTRAALEARIFTPT